MEDFDGHSNTKSSHEMIQQAVRLARFFSCSPLEFLNGSAHLLTIQLLDEEVLRILAEEERVQKEASAHFEQEYARANRKF